MHCGRIVSKSRLAKRAAVGEWPYPAQVRQWPVSSAAASLRLAAPRLRAQLGHLPEPGALLIHSGPQRLCSGGDRV